MRFMFGLLGGRPESYARWDPGAIGGDTQRFGIEHLTPGRRPSVTHRTDLSLSFGQDVVIDRPTSRASPLLDRGEFSPMPDTFHSPLPFASERFGRGAHGD